MTYPNDPFIPPAAPEGTPGITPGGAPELPPYGYAPTPPTAAPAQTAAAPMTYAPPAPYGYAMPAPPHADQKNWMGIIALVGGLLGIFVGLLTSVPAIVFGHLGRSAAKRGEATNGGLALAGLITAYVAAALWILGTIAYIVLVVVFATSQSSY